MNLQELQLFSSLKMTLKTKVKEEIRDVKIKGKFAVLSKDYSLFIGFVDGDVQPRKFKVTFSNESVIDNYRSNQFTVSPRDIDRTKFEQRIGDMLTTLTKNANKQYKVEQNILREKAKLKEYAQNEHNVTEKIAKKSHSERFAEAPKHSKATILERALNKDILELNTGNVVETDDGIRLSMSLTFPIYDYHFDGKLRVDENIEHCKMINTRLKSEKSISDELKKFLEDNKYELKELIDTLDRLDRDFSYTLSYRNLYYSSRAHLTVNVDMKEQELDYDNSSDLITKLIEIGKINIAF